MRYYQRSMLIGVLVFHSISSTFSFYASENKHHGRGYRDQARDIGVLQYSQEQNNGDSMYEDFDNIKADKSTMSSFIGSQEFVMMMAAILVLIIIVIIIVCICYFPNLFDLVCCCCDLCELFSLCLPNTN